ncbi:MAG: PqqD family protein [Pyrinomonadaceae bacterium]|nr:PqqD family protein [Pyrinomonadaceae bacterium]
MFDSISTSEFLPKARTSDIVVQEIDNETLVYDLGDNKAHQLNETMSLIWKNCDGQTSIVEVVEKLEQLIDSKIDADFIEFALSELQNIKLLSEPNKSDSMPNISRRDIAFKYAPIAVALPIVISLVAPAAAQMASCLPPSTIGNFPNDPQCVTPADCCDNNCGDFSPVGFFCQPPAPMPQIP